MKKITLFLLLSFILLSFSNCKKDNEDNEPPPPTYFLKAKMNGQSISTSPVTAFHVGPFIDIAGIHTADHALALSISEDLTTGTYSFDLATTEIVAAGYGNSLPDGIAVNAESGSITITEFNKSTQIISGTFEFSGTDDNSGDLYIFT